MILFKATMWYLTGIVPDHYTPTYTKDIWLISYIRQHGQIFREQLLPLGEGTQIFPFIVGFNSPTKISIAMFAPWNVHIRTVHYASVFPTQTPPVLLFPDESGTRNVHNGLTSIKGMLSSMGGILRFSMKLQGCRPTI